MKRWALFLATAGAAVWLSIPFRRGLRASTITGTITPPRKRPS